MKRNIAILLTVMMGFFAFSAGAQVSVAVAVNRSNYLLFEPIYAKVILRNFSGQSLAFSDDAAATGTLKFFIEMPDRTRAELRKNAFSPMTGIILKPGATEEVLVPITRLYVLTKPGNLRMRAVISHKQLPSEYESPATTFTICNGLPVWERSVGVPDLFKKNKEESLPPRKVKIVTFNDGKDKVYCLIIEDGKYVYGVARIGADIGNFPPTCEIDGLSKVHIMIQVSPNVFSYFIYDVNCELSEKEVYVKSGTAPTLVLDPKEGTVVVVGGRKGIKDVDFVEEQGIPKLTKEVD
ncbi:MAG TPA: hypothetical protein DCZ94_03340 [Lentisphaeria bacterium]|nr:hypothetical protein [Lentisphaeria bacterium]